MKCSKCGEELEFTSVKGLKFQYCTKCNGIWIPFMVLKKMSEMINLKSDIINPAEMENIKVKEELRKCPECGKPLDKVYFNGVILDKCNDCNKIWFDNGELAKYFTLFMKNPPMLVDNIVFINKYCDLSLKQVTDYKGLDIQSKEKEKIIQPIDGFTMVFLLIAAVLFMAFSLFFMPLLFMISSFIIMPLFLFMISGFRLVKPQEAIVLTRFGKYVGTIKKAGFFWYDPFARPFGSTSISLKAMTLDNGKQKINDESGNPIEVGIVVIWELQDTAKAVFNVENYKSFIAVQSDSALRNIVRMYPYDAPEESGVQSLRGDSAEISSKLKAEIQKNVRVAGINVIDAKITHLAYAPEIAVALLQRQQAAAVIDAKRAIVEGAVSMVEMALNRLSQNDIVNLDEAEKAKMVNNLLVVLCSNKETQPVIKNGI